MILHFIQGATLALSAALMPGPFQAFLLSQALKNGWKRTLPASLAPLLTDGPIIALVLFVLIRTPQWLLDLLRSAGGVFIIYLALNLLKGIKDPLPPSDPGENVARQTLVNAVIMNFLNPNPYIFWGVIGGPIVIAGWRKSPGFGASFLVGFYGCFIFFLAGLIIIFATAGRIAPRINRTLCAASATALLFFGTYQMATGLAAFW